MLFSLLVASPLMLASVKDTVWWNNQGGTVMEHRDDNRADCALTLHGQDASVVLDWTTQGALWVTASASNWTFANGQNIPAAMQVGDVWLSDGANSAILPAVAHGNAVTFPVAKPVDELLRSAGRIEVQIKGSALSISPNHFWLNSLLDHLQLCREAIRRIGAA